MAQVIAFVEAVRARRRARDRVRTAECIDILRASLRLALRLAATGPRAERPVRAHQVRQLAELLEYVARDA
ncbi:MAG: hypothetical protein A3J75_04895 [Acidobacteria bacterium RBG_16_68_9]|nr:MAG: hypothetical protein A3J75_04895 [Acidobacteria bacterium RBG_16_68_9]